MEKIISVNEEGIKDKLGELVRGTVEETLNAMLDAEAEALCGAKRYERSECRQDYRSGHYERELHSKAGDVTLRVPKLRKLRSEHQLVDPEKVI
jgi:transposase-like protein